MRYFVKRNAQIGCIFLISLCVVWGASINNAFAEVKHDSKNRFWMDVPEGWQWYEDYDSVTVISPGGTGSVRINLEVADGIRSDEDAERLVRQNMASRIGEVASRNGKTVAERERKIDGVFALQSGFLIAGWDRMSQATALMFYKNRYLFNIYFEAPREFQRLEMEAIVDTIKFEPPPPPEEEKTETSRAAEPAAEKKPQEPAEEEVVLQDLNQNDAQGNLFCVNAFGAADRVLDFVIDTPHDYQALLERYRMTGPPCQDFQPPDIDFFQYTLLGKFADARACRTDWKRQVVKLKNQKIYRYTITVQQKGGCGTSSLSMNWVLVPKIPADYKVVFEVKKERDGSDNSD